MTAKPILCTISFLFIVLLSCKSKEQRDAENYMGKIQQTMKENSTQQTTGDKTMAPVPADMKSILGDWELVKVFADKNGNHQVDPGEDKEAITSMKDLLILNQDGSAVYTIARMEATWEIETKDDGRKKLLMYDKTGAEINRGRYIISVTNDELVINRLMGGSDFEIFKRL